MILIISTSAVFAAGDQETDGFTAGMVTDTGGLGDQSFNDGVYAGLERAEINNSVSIRIAESRQQSDYIPNLTGMADDGTNIVFAVGFLMAEAVVATANDYPDTLFAGIDIFVDETTAPDNLIGILFKEHESGYLAGVLAGLLTKEYADASPKLNDANVVGTVLGLLVPPVERFEVGYRAGVKKYNPDARVISIVAGSFTDATKGKEAAIAMIEQGADIIFQIAGGTGIGAINAAREAGVLAIGVDIDQNNIAPDTVITSAIKKLTSATYLTVQSALNNSFEGGKSVSLGIAEDATGLAPFHSFEDVVPQEIKDILAREIEDMKAGRTNIPTTRAEAEAMGV